MLASLTHRRPRRSRRYFDELGLTQQSVDFVLGTAGTSVQGERCCAWTPAGFPFSGIMFEEYNATATLSTGLTETLIPANEGIAFPLGTMDTFVTYGAAANLIETVNTVGVPIYARQIARPDGSAIDVKTEASPCRSTSGRGWAVKIHTSN